MRRLFALIGFTYLITLTVAIFLSEKILIICLLVNVFIFIVSLFIKDVRKGKLFPTALFTSLLALTVYTFNFKVNVLPVRELCNKDITISGVICDLPYNKNGRYYYTLEVDKIMEMNNKGKFKMNLSSSGALDADIYDRITANVHTFTPNSGSGFYSQQYSMSKKVYVSAFLYDYQPIEFEENTNKPLNYYILNFRKKVISSMHSILPETHAAIANGVLLGEKYGISENAKEKFIRIGVYHLLAASGIHMALLSTILLSGLKKIGIKRNIATLLTIIFILFFMSINCFTPSIVRASVMLIIYLLGNLIGRKSDSINSLGLSVLLLSIANPNIGGDVRVWLSSLSIIGIMTFQGKVEYGINLLRGLLFKDNKLSRYIVKSFSLTLSVMIATFPITIIFFKRLSLIAPIGNVLMMFPITATILLSVVCSMLYLMGIPRAFIMPLLAVLKLIIDYLIIVADFLSKIPFACVSVEYKFVYLWVASVLILIGLCFVFGDIKKQLKFISLLSLNILFVGIISYNLLMRNITRLSILDVGNGCSLILSKNRRNAVLSCGGEEYYCSSMINYLEAINANNIDFLLVPSTDEESDLFFHDIEEKYNYNSMVLPRSIAAERNLKFKDIKVKPVKFKEKVDIKIWNNIKINTTNVDGKSWIFMEIDDISILICPSGGNARRIPREWQQCDIFIAGGLPANCNLINPIYNILSENKESCEINFSKLSYKCLNSYVTSGYGTINIDIKNPGTITVGREM